MRNRNRSSIEAVNAANVSYHASFADKYEKTQPYYDPRNVNRIRDIFYKIGGGKMLDVGCGTGFLIDIAHSFFDVVIGVDITDEMLDRVVDRRNVVVGNADAYKLPFKDNTFDVVASYSFLHHLFSPPDVIDEIHRVLRPGGVYYNDQDPSRLFNLGPGRSKFEACCKKVCDMTGETERVVKLAEYQEFKNAGLVESELREWLSAFKKVDIKYRWPNIDGLAKHKYQVIWFEAVK